MYWRVEPQRVEPASRGMRFSSYEVLQILMAVGALTLAFSISQLIGRPLLDPFLIGLVVLAAFISVVTAFLLHELAHKAVAQRYGCYAEFRAFPMGLFLGIATAIFGFLFAAPGAVMISGPVSARQNARISAAGPGTNFGLAAGFFGLALLLGTATGDLAFISWFIAASVGSINLFLGGFNMVPFPPLDGSKIFAYNKPLWAAMVAVLIAIGYAGWRLGVFFI